MSVLKITNKNFEEEVLNSDKPVIIDFYADWCGPCKAMSPVVEALAEEYAGKIKVGKINVDNNQDIAMKYGVMSIPTFIFFKDGKNVSKTVGMQTKRELVNAIEALL